VKADRASATARLIAAATVLCEFDCDENGRAPPGAAEWCAIFLSTNRLDRLLLRSVRSRVGRVAWRALERATLPNIVDHWMRRKREIDRLCRRAAGEGFTQLLVLGAGMDSLAFRMNRHRAFSSVLSADHPATLMVINTALGNSRQVHLYDGGVHLLAIDLTKGDVPAILCSARNFDGSAQTLIVVEGVLMYLRETDACNLLRAIAVLPLPRKRIIGSWMRSEPGEPIGFRGQSGLITRWLGERSEPMLWASTPTDLPALLQTLGWRNRALLNMSEIDVTTPNQHRVEGEWLFVAES
jgi:methyltransferase (TIGR00027 family)